MPLINVYFVRISTTSLLFFFLFISCAPSSLCALGHDVSNAMHRDSTPYLALSDSILLQEDRMANQLKFVHRIKNGQSLYGVAAYYGLKLDDIYLLNPRLRAGYQTGDEVEIVMPPVALRSFIPYDSIDYFVPAFWTLEKGQTIYGLTHRLLKLPSEEVLYINNPGIEQGNLKLGQQLFIGWMSINGISSEMQAEVEDPYVRLNKGMREQWESSSKGKKLKSANGKAAWASNGDRNKFMALHRTAPLNSLVEIMDKRTGKTLYCRVVGRIPDQVYDQNVQVVVSPLLVKAFGVRDRYFYVQVKHY